MIRFILYLKHTKVFYRCVGEREGGNLIKQMIVIFVSLLFSGGILSADEKKPISLFQIDFDLSFDNALEVASARFNCEINIYSGVSYCQINNTSFFSAENQGKQLSKISFYCSAFDGCGYSEAELIESLSDQKSLIFLSGCSKGDLGELVCVEKGPKIVMYRKKFRAKTLSFD